MAFTNPAIAAVGVNFARLTAQLAAGANGTVAAVGTVADVNLPAGHDAIGNNTVALFNTTAVGGGLGGVSVVKAAGVMTITNLDGANTITFEVFIGRLHSTIQ